MLGAESHCTKLLRDSTTGCTTDTSLTLSPVKFIIEKGIKQVDINWYHVTIKVIDWTGDVHVNNEELTHFLFAYDIVLLIAEIPDQLGTMLMSLNTRNLTLSLRLNHN